MSRRFFARNVVPNAEFVLEGEQAHHIHNVMRFKPGDSVILFDGCGTEYQAEIVEGSKKKIQLDVGIAVKSGWALAVELTIACCLPKGDRQKFLVEKLVELGASRLVPLKTERSVSEAPAKVVTRIEKQIVEACKQCERNWLMQVGAQQTLKNMTAELKSQSSDRAKLYIATPGAERQLSKECFEGVERVVIAIGPEGGFSEREQATAIELGWLPISLAPTILRIETAAIAATVVVGNAT